MFGKRYFALLSMTFAISCFPLRGRGIKGEGFEKKKNPLSKLYLFRILLKDNFSQPKGTQFHSTQLCFVGSASVPKARVYFYSVFANECETIQLIYVVGVATPTYYLFFNGLSLRMALPVPYFPVPYCPYTTYRLFPSSALLIFFVYDIIIKAINIRKKKE